jgi:3-oxoacyl-[acyl-carrier-protein] synthase II
MSLADSTNKRRVVVTGIGAVSSLGIGYAALCDGLFAGRNGCGPISRFDAGGLTVRAASEARDYTDDLLPSDPRHHRILSRAMRLGLVAANEALKSAGLDDQPELRASTACLMTLNRQDIHLADFGESFARSMLPGEGDQQYVFSRSRLLNRGIRALHPLWLLSFIPNLAVAHIARTFGLRGESNTYTAEAAAGLQLVGDAAHCIREGLFDVALCGGSDGRIDPVSFARYLALGDVAESGPDSTDLSRPFDANRCGYVFGEGAAFLVLEEAAHASRRGVPALAEVIGSGGGSDGFHPYNPHPEGRGLQIAMSAALASAGRDVGAVDTVVAAAASTPAFDDAESAALASVFGRHEPSVTAPAGALGYTHSAVGAFASVVAVAALAAQAVPPTANTRRPAQGAPSGLVYGTEARSKRVRTVLANAVSPGGKAASTLFSEVSS